MSLSQSIRDVIDDKKIKMAKKPYVIISSIHTMLFNDNKMARKPEKKQN